MSNKFIFDMFIKKTKAYSMTANFYENFGSIWERFLNFEINRSREAIKYFGNANTYFILQTVAWHNLHLVQKEEGSREYERLKKQWGSNIFDFGKHIPGKLSILTVSQISGIDKETCRRVVKKLISDGWVTYLSLIHISEPTRRM